MPLLLFLDVHRFKTHGMINPWRFPFWPPHIVIDVDLLDANVREGNSEAKCAGPIMFRKACQGSTVGKDHQTLHNENRR